MKYSNGFHSKPKNDEYWVIAEESANVAVCITGEGYEFQPRLQDDWAFDLPIPRIKKR